MGDPVMIDLERHMRKIETDSKRAEEVADEAVSFWRAQFPDGLNGRDIAEAMGDLAPDRLHELFALDDAAFGAQLRTDIAAYWVAYCNRHAEERVYGRREMAREAHDEEVAESRRTAIALFGGRAS